MIYSGIISDSKGSPIPGAVVSFVNGSGSNIVSFPADVTGYWQFDTDTDGGLLDPGNTVHFSGPGYGDYYISSGTLQPTFDVTLSKKINPALYVGLGAAAVVLLASARGKRVGKIKSEDVRTGIYIVGGVVAFTVVKKALESLNIWTSPEKKELNDIVTNPGSYWNPGYWQKVGGGNAPMSESNASDLLYNLISNAFGIIYDSPDNALAVFKQLRSKAEVSYLSYILNKTKGQDLLTLLRNGGGIFPWDGLSDANVLLINNYTNSLPDY